jgi:hypothetical protein
MLELLVCIRQNSRSAHLAGALWEAFAEMEPYCIAGIV